MIKCITLLWIVFDRLFVYGLKDTYGDLFWGRGFGTLARESDAWMQDQRSKDSFPPMAILPSTSGLPGPPPPFRKFRYFQPPTPPPPPPLDP